MLFNIKKRKSRRLLLNIVFVLSLETLGSQTAYAEKNTNYITVQVFDKIYSGIFFKQWLIHKKKATDFSAAFSLCIKKFYKLCNYYTSKIRSP